MGVNYPLTLIIIGFDTHPYVRMIVKWLLLLGQYDAIRHIFVESSFRACFTGWRDLSMSWENIGKYEKKNNGKWNMAGDHASRGKMMRKPWDLLCSIRFKVCDFMMASKKYGKLSWDRGLPYAQTSQTAGNSMRKPDNIPTLGSNMWNPSPSPTSRNGYLDQVPISQNLWQINWSNFHAILETQTIKNWSKSSQKTRKNKPPSTTQFHHVPPDLPKKISN